MDEVPLGPICQTLGLSFIIWYLFDLEVLRDRFLPVHVRVGWPSNGYYFCPSLPSLANWPCRGSRVSFWGWCQAVLTRWAPQHRCRAFFLERDGRFDEIAREHAQGGLLTARTESGEGVCYFVVTRRGYDEIQNHQTSPQAFLPHDGVPP
jgi:hypothetical protein